MKRCLRFARLMAKQNGMTYAEATKKYPRGCTKNSVYRLEDTEHSGHCVHCARAEVMSKEDDEIKER